MIPAAIQDPFLQRLVRKDVLTTKKVAQKAKDLMKDAPEVEKELILRAESTKEHLAQLFDLQESYNGRLTALVSSAAQSAEPALQEEVRLNPPLALSSACLWPCCWSLTQLAQSLCALKALRAVQGC